MSEELREVNGMFFAVSAAEIQAEADQEELLDEPPPEANYRPAEIEAVACWNCSHFEKTGVGDDNWPVGICHLWEARVQGENVSDRFTVTPVDSPSPDTPQTFDDFDFSLASEIFVDDTGMEFSEEDGMVTKTILRTGEWKKTPSTKGVIKKTLKIVRDGASSAAEGIVSLSELVNSFKDKAYPYVTIPLTDDKNDHKNLLKLNQGFVKDLWIDDGEDGISRLKAKLNFTEPDTRGKVERGTYPDVSAGVYFNVERPDGEKFGSAINHVCLTPRPFIDGLEPFGVAASDDSDHEFESFVPEEAEREEAKGWDERLGLSWQRKAIKTYMAEELNLSDNYLVEDIGPERAIVSNEIAEVSWVVPFSIEQDGVTVAPVAEWEMRETDSEEDEGSSEPEEPAAAPSGNAFADRTPLQQARTLRALAFSSSSNGNHEGGVSMSGTTDTLEGIDFSNEEEAKAAVQRIVEENASLRRKDSAKELESKIEAIKGMGFADAPGFLAKCRDIYRSDDQRPAMVLFSYDDNGNEIGKREITASELLDDLLSTIPKDDDGKVLLSQQHLTTGNDDPPPADDNDGKPSVEERTRAAAEAIGQQMPDSGGKE